MGYVRTGGYQVRDRHAAMARLPSMDKTRTNFKSLTPSHLHTVIPADWEKQSELNWLSLMRQKVKYYPTQQFNDGCFILIYINWAACCECMNKKIQLHVQRHANKRLGIAVVHTYLPQGIFSWGILTLCYR